MNKRVVSTLVLSSLMASILLFEPTSSYALVEKKVLKNERGEIHNLVGDLGSLRGVNPQERALDALSKVKGTYGIKDVAKEFKVKKMPEPKAGVTGKKSLTKSLTHHTRLDRVMNGVPVYGEQLIVHEKNGRLSGVTGKYKPLVVNATKATLSNEAAEQKALEYTGYQGELAVPITSELTYLPQGDQAILTYKVNVCYLGGNTPGDWIIFVSAVDGSIVNAFNSAAEAIGIGTGADLEAKWINTVKKGNEFYLEDRTKMMALQGGTINTYTYSNGTTSQAYVVDTDNVWDDELQRAAVDAHYNASIVYDFYLNELGRNSYDDMGAPIISNVHYSKDYNNAFWSGGIGQMVYGDGDGELMTSLSGALDVVAHEITHAVIQYTADLIYQDQSGALNESWADALGTAIENENWLLGEEIWTPGIEGDALRYMDDPELGDQPGHMDQYVVTHLDNGGVHINSGIPNKAFYHFAEAIGSRVEAGKVWYLALRDYMTPNTDFSGARAATLLACEELYGKGSDAYQSLQTAWTNVGIE
ncbi:M4 family metallopeptidase [Ammoniphilus sp. CFH 90114]|uniref:M4 family metallopeptidase n=1 Tax=Ammoniphilus sp. CFH 90114 TaxID=2493665 RepID=UPI00100E6D07|nr:M4 family metallopeptidase [Ammoniphilus sp. CFH 90114]RXT03688.1 peptidase M4 family protein [Ammoniphilus sp. CFH 90114]